MNAEQTRQKIEELEALRSQARIWRTLTALIVIAIVVICVSLVIRSARTLFRQGPAQEEFVAELKDGFAHRVVPPVREIVTETLTEIRPLVQQEFNKLDQRTPEIAEAIKKEWEALRVNVPHRGERVLKATFADLLKKRETKIREMFPDVSEERVGVMMTNLVDEGERRAVVVLDRLFEDHEKTLEKILEHLTLIQELEAETATQEMSTWEMAGLFFDVIREDFEGLDEQEYGEAVKETLPRVRK